jgi:hypothetical protein
MHMWTYPAGTLLLSRAGWQLLRSRDMLHLPHVSRHSSMFLCKVPRPLHVLCRLHCARSCGCDLCMPLGCIFDMGKTHAAAPWMLNAHLQRHACQPGGRRPSRGLAASAFLCIRIRVAPALLLVAAAALLATTAAVAPPGLHQQECTKLRQIAGQYCTPSHTPSID